MTAYHKIGLFYPKYVHHSIITKNGGLSNIEAPTKFKIFKLLKINARFLRFPGGDTDTSIPTTGSAQGDVAPPLTEISGLDQPFDASCNLIFCHRRRGGC